VLTEHVIINLVGKATDLASRYQAEDIAKRTPGVRGVVNDIAITSSQDAPATDESEEPMTPAVIESIESK
jgi:hypothetical protein